MVDPVTGKVRNLDLAKFNMLGRYVPGFSLGCIVFDALNPSYSVSISCTKWENNQIYLLGSADGYTRN